MDRVINRLPLWSAVLTTSHYNTASHSPIHTPTAQSTMQGDGGLVRSSQGEEVSASGGPPPHSARRRSRGSNQQPSGYKSTLPTP